MRRLVIVLAVLTGGCTPAGLHARHIAGASARPEARAAHSASGTGTSRDEDAVLAAYLRSRAVDVHAFADLDPAGLTAVFADSALASRLNEIDDRRREGRPMAVRMAYHPHVTLLGPALAVVDDDVENHSVRLDPATGLPVEADPDELLQDTYTLERREGRWLVVLTARVGS